MFADLEPRAPDAILGLMERFRADDRPDKVSLASGVYVDESGTTPVLDTVREAEARILAAQTTKVYKPIGGDPAYTGPVRDLVFGADHPAVAGGRVETLHTPGGTGALRVAGDLVAAIEPGAAVWLSTPTWPNHPQVFAAAGLPIRSYPYLGADGELDIETMLSVLRSVPAGDVVVLHGCCHNPTGIDPTPEQWGASPTRSPRPGPCRCWTSPTRASPTGSNEDARGLDALLARERTMFVARSFSKNFALYDERVGALSIVGADGRGDGHTAVSRQGRHPCQLLQPARARRRDRGHRPRRRGAARTLGRRGRHDARPDQRQPPGVRGRPAGGRRARQPRDA